MRFTSITLAVAMTLMSGASMAGQDCTGPDGVVCNKRLPVKKWQPTTVNNTNVPVAVSGAESDSYASAVSSSGAASVAGATGGNVGSVDSSINVEAPRLAQAPDVISYPTAPCRISVGVSGGWIGGAIGVSSSTLDENCQRIETSRHLHNLGAKDAAIQVMCLSPDAKQALEATGVKCLIAAAAPQETVKP